MERVRLAVLCTVVITVTNSCGLVNRLANNSAENMPGAPYDVIIVPGLPYNATKANPIYKARMLWAKWLYDRKIARNIIFSGAAVHNPYIEGQAMKIMADSLGIPSKNTFAEIHAQHTTENVDYSIQLARQLGFKKIAIATDPMQSHYIRKFLDRWKLNVVLVPFPLQMMPAYYKEKVPAINATGAFIKDFIPVDKRETAYTN